MTSEASSEKSDLTPSLLTMAADIVSAYVSKNAVPANELPTMILEIHASLEKLATCVVDAPGEAPKEPAVPIKKSVTNEYIICLDDGKKFRSLKRHLSAANGMTPAEYRIKWGLPPEYPMVAPGYGAIRSELARKAGLGSKSPNQAKKKSTKKAA